MKKYGIVAIGMLLLTCAVFAKNPVTVGPSGDFASIQLAIDSWCAGGANAAETPPFIINIDPAGGPYDESINLQSTQVGHGDIVGSIVIQSATPGTYAHIKVRDRGTTGDGIIIHQSTADVTFKDLLIYPSTTNAITDDLIKIDEDTPNLVLNTFLFDNVILTDIDIAGNPLITDKSQAFTYPTATVATTRSNGFASLFQAWNDAGESMNVTLRNCCIYGNTVATTGQASVRISLDGDTVAETFTMENCIVAWANAALIRVGGKNPGDRFIFTGTDQTDGPNNCNIFLNRPNATGGGNAVNDCLWTYSGDSVAGTSMLVEKTIMASVGPIEGTGSVAVGGISLQGTINLTLKDSIISTVGPCVTDLPNGAVTFDRVTLNNISDPQVASPVAFQCTTGGTGSVTIRDCIFSGPGAKIGGTGAPAGGIDIDYCGFPTAGAYAIGSQDNGTVVPAYGTNIISADPEFVSNNPTSADLFDVAGSLYYNASSTAGALAGGADFVGVPPTPTPIPLRADRVWNIYE